MIYHITSRTSWQDAAKSGVYTADTLTTQGFIHCSKADQVVRVADTWYTGQRGLVLLEIDETRLKSEIRWEPGTDPVRAANAGGTPVRDGKADELFPHIYGPLNVDAVTHVHDFDLDPSGHFSLPPSLIR
jgi:uncharacterized protein (DUF952 family)